MHGTFILSELSFALCLRMLLSHTLSSFHLTNRSYLACLPQAMHKAAANGHLDCLKLLVAAGAKTSAVSPVGNTPLHLVRSLLCTSSDHQPGLISFRSCIRPWVQAAFSGHTAVVEALLESGASADAANKAGNTPLHFAAQKGHAAIVAPLLKSGAQMDARSKTGNTPLHLAAQNGHVAVVQPLLEFGHPTDHSSNEGSTPLHLVRSPSSMITRRT